jgi:tRNA wybutosine-synthesizing protein 3
MNVFDQRKTKILHDLQSTQPDHSPKGEVDEGVLDLLELLNNHEDYVTTSSCSGRAVVFLAPPKDGPNSDGKGRWLMTTHSPLDSQRLAASSLPGICEILLGGLAVGDDWVCNVRPTSLVTLKFEPLVS